MKLTAWIIVIFPVTGCYSQPNQSDSVLAKQTIKTVAAPDSNIKTIHVYVALCDNKYQGIVPVPKKIGNGQDPFNNLYWGCGYGVKSYFKNSTEWKLLKTTKDSAHHILERCIFKHKTKAKTYMVADAYDGQYIKQCTVDFLRGTAGIEKDTLTIDGKTIGTKGNASLTAYIGHNGLMDFNIGLDFENTDGEKRDAIILACKSKSYFTDYLKQTNGTPLVWTTGLMAPEAYTLHDAISGWLNNETDANIRLKAAAAYHKYQKCGEKAARNLLVTGF